MKIWSYLTAIVVLMNGCAFIDTHLFDPAATHARVAPLFRSPECERYQSADGGHWLSTLFSDGSTRNMSSMFFKSDCEYQSKSIKDSELGWISKKSQDTQKQNDDLLICGSSASESSCFNYLLSRSDEICDVHKSQIYGNRTAMNTIFQILATGAGIAGSMSGAGAAQALAGAAGFLTGGQAIMNEEIYQNLVTQAILKEIEDSQQTYKTEKQSEYSSIHTNNSPINFGKIRLDAIEYHNKCSFYTALTSLLNRSSKGNTSNKALSVLTKKKEDVDSAITDLESKLKATDPKPTTNELNKLNDSLTKLKIRQSALDAIISQVVVEENKATKNNTTNTTETEMTKTNEKTSGTN